MNGEKIQDLGTPTASTDAATKAYVDAQLSADLSSLITVTDGSNSTALGDGDTLTFSGTANEVTVSESAGTITVGLPATAVTAGSYGSSTAIPTFTVDANGRLTAAGTTAISSDMTIAADSGSDTITVGTDTFTITGGTGLSTAATTDTITVNLDNSGVTAASYGSATAIPVLTINAQGQVTAASTASVSSDLPVAGDSGTGTISLLTETLTVAGGSNITTSMSGNTLTVALDASPSVTALTTSGDVTVGGSLNSDDITAATMTASGNVIVQGNLTVNGTTTTVNSNTVNIGDNMLVLNSDETGTPSQNGGIEIERGTSTNVSFYWDESNDRWSTGTEDLYAGGGFTGNLTGNVTGNVTGDLTGNADTASAWATARTLSLTGAVTGSASVDGSGNVSLATTATSDPTLTLAGDASGSATFTNLGNATLTVTVADDSHNHVVGNIDGLAEYIADTAGAMWSSNTESGVSVTYDDTDNTLDINVNDPTITLTGDVSGSATMTNLGNVSITATVADDSHNHIIGNVDGLQAALDGKLATTHDMSLTLSGDASGSATFTDMGNATLSVTVANDSHTHDGRYYTESELGANGTSNTTSGAYKIGTYDEFGNSNSTNVQDVLDDLDAAISTVAGKDPTLTLAGDASGSATFTNLGNATLTVAVANDSHTHDGRYYTESEVDTLLANNASASTTYTDTAISNLIGGAPAALDTLNELAAAINDDASYAASVTTALGGKVGTSSAQALGSAANVMTVSNATITLARGDGTTDQVTVNNVANANACSGNAATATTATNANNLYINNDDTGDTNCPILFSANTTAGYKAVYEDSAFYFDNTNNTLYATLFSGTATAARYADLAEKYAADGDIEPGTVVCFGGDAEVQVCDHDMDRKVAGVVSTDPAYMMNSDAEGVYVALTGRVPCKVVGPVRKGDMMVSAGNGAARAEENPVLGSVIGKALENFDGEEGVIEVVVGRL